MSLIEILALGFTLVHTVSLGDGLSIECFFAPREILLKYAPVALRSPRGECGGTCPSVVL